MRIDYVAGAKLVTEYFSTVLRYFDDKVFSLIRTDTIPHPEFVFAGARHLEVLINLAAGFVEAGARGIPFAFSALRPFRGDARAANSPARNFRFREIQPRRIEQRLVQCAGRKAAHIFSLEPNVFRM